MKRISLASLFLFTVLALNAQSLEVEWVKGIVKNDCCFKSYESTIDPADNIIVGGDLILLEDDTLFLLPEYHAIVNDQFPEWSTRHILLKFNSEGNLIWEKQFKRAPGPEPGAERIYSIDSDATGNIYVTLRQFGMMDFDLGPEEFVVNPVNDIPGLGPYTYHQYLAKYDTDGEFQWVLDLGYSYDIGSETNGPSIKVDSEGSVIVTGPLLNHWDFDPGPDSLILESSGGISATKADAFIAKYSDQGQLIWAHALNSEFKVIGAEVEVDNQNNIIITGSSIDSLHISPNTNPIEPGSFVIKFDPLGDPIWHESLYDSPVIYDPILSVSCAIGSDNTIHLYYQDLITTNDTSLAANVISKFSEDGNQLWTKYIPAISEFDSITGSIGINWPQDIAINALDELFISGINRLYTMNNIYESNFDFEEPICFFVIQFDIDGEVISLKEIPTTYPIEFGTTTTHLICDSDGEAILTGSHSGLLEMAFGTDSIELPDSEYHGFIYKLNSIPNLISEFESTKHFTLYPNPTSDVFYLDNPSSQQLLIEVHDKLGRVITQKNSRETQLTIDLTKQSLGMYFVRVSDGIYKETLKVIKQ